MIRLRYLWMSLVLPMITACNEWLDVESENLADDGRIFENHEGFRNSLNGIYYKLSETGMYGQELSWGFLSVLAQTYDENEMAKNDAYEAAMEYDYETDEVKAIISNIWSGGYNAIANCNKLIKETEAKDSTFFPEGSREKNLILGEALALRAYIHLDMARLFAPAPVTGDDGAYIPYVTEYPTHYTAYLPTSEVLRLAKADLLRARDLVAKNDTLYDGTAYANRFVPDDSGNRFFSFRGTRMNYLSICGTLARLCLWAGDKNDAYLYASEVYDLVEEHKDEWGIYFTPVDNLNVADANKYVKAPDDILFAFYNADLITEIEDFTGTADKPQMYLRNANSLFDGRSDGDDYRSYLVDWTTGAIRSYKWRDLGATDNLVQIQYNLIPALRLSEIYYILSETAMDRSEGVRYLNEVRNGRGCKRMIQTDVTESAFNEELIWEGMKEYLTEGQTFFLYKRLNRPIISGDESIDVGNGFVLPLPDNENIF